jgi:excisionase family DNA binding protein
VSDEPKKHRFLTIEQAAEELSVSPSQIRALLKTGELRAIQVGGTDDLACLLGLMRIIAGITGQKRRLPRGVSVRFVRTVERRCVGVGRDFL